MPPGFRAMRRQIICRAPRALPWRVAVACRCVGQAASAVAARLESKVSGYLRRVKA